MAKKLDKNVLQNLKAFCKTARQNEFLETIIVSGGVRAAAKALDINHTTITKTLKTIRENAALQGFSPEHDLTKTIPETHYLKGASTLYDADGKPRLQWVKSNAKFQDMMSDLRDFAEALGENTKERFVPAKKLPKSLGLSPDLLTVYPLADLHFGMLAWSAETGEDYDTKIAADAMQVAAGLLCEKSPPAETAIIAQLGDFFHFDSDKKMTSSGNILDVDSRWTNVIGLGVQCLLYFVRLALEKHQNVKIINSIGNHDGQSALMLPFILKPYFANEPRVTIEDAPRMHHYHLFGANCLGFHHGDKTRPKQLHGVMTQDVLLNPAIDSSKVEFAHWLTGHIHHESKEFDGILVESFRTLAAKDAWHTGAGYRSLRDIQSVTYHRHFGECDRVRVSWKMVQHYSQSAQTKSSTKR